ncbi:hypothetical protein [Comamonas thiooxydans]|uniref:hypothetical protein n=1 Tax=Comamonas thiooxydans TaxID=363952 RepID=UPI00118543A6|nr:hypothetical protein [Comamonas thiooxydans]
MTSTTEFYCRVPVTVVADSYQVAQSTHEAAQLALAHAREVAKLTGSCALDLVMGDLLGVQIFDASQQQLLLDTTPVGLLGAEAELLKKQLEACQVNAGGRSHAPALVAAAMGNFLMVQRTLGGGDQESIANDPQKALQVLKAAHALANTILISYAAATQEA